MATVLQLQTDIAYSAQDLLVLLVPNDIVVNLHRAYCRPELPVAQGQRVTNNCLAGRHCRIGLSRGHPD